MFNVFNVNSVLNLLVISGTYVFLLYIVFDGGFNVITTFEFASSIFFVLFGISLSGYTFGVEKYGIVLLLPLISDFH